MFKNNYFNCVDPLPCSRHGLQPCVNLDFSEQA